MAARSYILVMFDLDGTLADTSFLHKRLFRAAMMHQGYLLEDEDLKPTLGMSLRDGLGFLLQTKFETVLPHAELDDFVVAINNSIKSQFVAELKKIPPADFFIPGALTTLEYLDSREDVIMAVVSNGARGNVDAVLDHMGIAHFIPHSIVGEEAQPKPSPEMIFSIHGKVEELGLNIGRVVFFGDTTADRGAVIAAREHIPHLEFYPIIGATHCHPEDRNGQDKAARTAEFRALADTLKIGGFAFADLRHVPHLIFGGTESPFCVRTACISRPNMCHDKAQPSV